MVKSSHIQDAGNTKTQTVITHPPITHIQTLTHTYARTHYLTNMKLTDIDILENDTRQT